MKPVGIAQLDDRVAYRLDCADKIMVVTKDGKGAVHLEEVLVADRDPLRRAQLIIHLEIQTLICGTVTGFVFRMLQHHGVQVIGGIMGGTREVLDQYLRGDLPEGKVLPGQCGRGPKPLCSRGQPRKRKMSRGHGPRKEEKNGKG